MDIQEYEIILVEDNDTDAELTMRALSKAHVSNPILRLLDGEEALNYFFSPKSDSEANEMSQLKLILLDLKLPLVSGLEVLKELKSSPRTQMIPVVVLTSSTQSQDIAESYRLGVNSYIAKPVEFNSFMEVIQKLGLYWLLLNKPPSAI
jgi:two-component system, response regulator